MTVVGRALMTEPKLVLLDEPSMGLAPKLIHEIFNIIMQLNKEQYISILLVEQNAKLALNVAPHAYVMETGRIVMDDTSEKLSQNEDIKDFYLGLTPRPLSARRWLAIAAGIAAHPRMASDHISFSLSSGRIVDVVFELRTNILPDRRIRVQASDAQIESRA